MEESKRRLIDYWLKTAEEDLRVVDHLFEKGDYTWALFLAHLVLEKVLKAYCVKVVDKEVPYTQYSQSEIFSPASIIGAKR